jgi:hypothetical protein
VLIDGNAPGAAHGIDVDEQGNGTVTEQRLRQLIRQPKPIADRQFEIEFLDSGVEAFALRLVDWGPSLFTQHRALVVVSIGSVNGEKKTW